MPETSAGEQPSTAQAGTLVDVLQDTERKGEREGERLPPRLANELHAHSYLKERLREDFPDIDDETLADTLEGETELSEALAAIIRSREEDQGLIEALKGRIEALRARLERFQDRADRKRRLVTDVMARAEIRRIVEEDFTVSLRQIPPAIVIEDEGEIPGDFWKPQPPKLDRTALTEALRSGQTVKGASLGAPRASITIRIA